ncbi:unnamed protein product [Bursaphelenchus xylophilus]|uniref:(pine wood nematode) hypothetical protein n=1 Tax=Bursaphelenchus xylophilus TaxID=6326 RepID=A0A1I7SCX2_BURXY|nr:unnamed protein product [Bursaphelenchus xylophilus]CAG9093318.1 unnamed protein product [Bursaphelenchus xylophilus]
MSPLPEQYHISIYSNFQYFALLLSTIMVVLTLIVVAKASPKNMGVYQWFIFNEVIGSYAFDAAYLLFQPVLILPYSCAYTAGPFRYANYKFTKMLVAIVLCLAYYKFVSLTAALFYRYLKSLPPNGKRRLNFLDYSRWVNAMLIVFVWLLLITIMLAALSKAEIGQEHVKFYVSSKSQVYAFVTHNEPSLICYWLNLEAGKFGENGAYVLVALLIIYTLFIIIIFVLAYLTVQNFLKSESSVMHLSFQRVHRILLISWGLQLSSLVIFIGIPFGVLILMLIFHPSYENYLSLVTLSMCGLHSMAECAILLIVVTPFRNYIRWEILKRKSRRDIAVRVVYISGKARRLPTPRNVAFYGHIQDLSLLLSTVIVGCTLFVVAKASPKTMSVYKWFIFNEVIGSYLFDVAYLTLQPVPLLPFSCVYSAGPFRQANFKLTSAFVKAVLCLSYYKFISLTATLFYRYLKALPPVGNGLLMFLDFPRWFNISLIVLAGVLMDLMMTTTFAQLEIPQDEVKHNISLISKEFAYVVQNENSLICYWLEDQRYGGHAVYFLAAVVLVFILFAAVIIVLASLTIRSFSRFGNGFMNPSFQRVHRMLLISWGLQLASLLIFCVIPFVLWIFMLIFHPPYENCLLLISLCMCGVHSMVECSILVLVITPYRKYLCQKAIVSVTRDRCAFRMVELPDPVYIEFYSIFQGLTFVVSTFTVCLTIFVVAKVSPKNMGVYKLFIYNEIIASYAFDAGYLLLQPVTLLPFSCAYSAGPLRGANYTSTRTLINVVVVLSYYKFMSLLTALFYRYLKSLPPSWSGIQQFLGYPKWLNIALLVSTFISIDATVLWTLSKTEIPQDQIKHDISLNRPDYSDIIRKETSLVCYWVHDDKYGGRVDYFIASVVLLGIFFTLGVSVLAYLTLRNFLRTDNIARISFQRIHRRLLLAWALQLASLIIFVGIPFFIWLFMLFIHPAYQNTIILVVLCVIGLHSMSECAILLFVVKPYRMFLLKLSCFKRSNPVLSRVKFFQGNSVATDEIFS